MTNLSRATITGFMKHLKLRSFEFTDSPLSKNKESIDQGKDKRSTIDLDD